jgi:superfamily II DNA helicase RecQ
VHEYFFEQDYAPVETLEAIYHRLSPQPQPKEDLCRALLLDPELFNRALDKLAIHGGAAIEWTENVTVGSKDWKQAYLAHLETKRAQLELMRRFAETHQCRMRALVRHFGDFTDSQRPCGRCDFCAPQQCIAQRFRLITQAERRIVYEVIEALRSVNSQTLGRLHQSLSQGGSLSRDRLEGIVGAMAAAGLVQIEDASFEKGGRTIPYRKAMLTREGLSLNDRTPLDLLLATNRAEEWQPAKRGKKKSPKPTKPPALILSVDEAAPKKKRPPQGQPRGPETFSPQESALEEKLRAWRSAEARKSGFPAYCVFSDQALYAIVVALPAAPAELLEINGIGPAKAEKYGRSILHICRPAKGEL